MQGTVLVPSYRDSHRGRAKAEDYDRGFAVPGSAKATSWEIERELLGAALRTHAPHPVRGAVDFACGTGRVLAFLQERVARCTGVDVSPEMLALARRRCPKARLVRADVTGDEQVELDHPVDVVTAFRFFLNAEPELRRRALRWIRGHLEPGGVLLANFHLNPHSVRGSYLRTRRLPDQPMLSLGDVRRLLADAGFAVVAQHGYEYLPFRRDGEHPVLPAARRRVERALARRARLTPVAGSFLIVARPAGNR